VHRIVREHWPEAPIVGSGARWARLRSPGGGVVYLQRYAWDEETRPHYVVAWYGDEDEPSQVRYPELLEALGEARARCEGALPAR
jgi:hypothetical protein